jgi:uncharacterized repeat protein (TIGR02543 family)
VENGSRTILPTAPATGSFAAYTLAFTATSGGENKSEDRTGANLAEPVTLKTGTYTLTVSAYLDAERTRLAARGTEANIVIGTGANVAKTVTLKTLSDTGNGTFSYNVTISASNVTGAAMAITKNGAAISGSPVTLNNTGATSASLTLASGVYNIRFTLIKGGAVKEEAVWNEMLYVYAELTSSFSITFDNDYFYRTHYNVTFVYNDEGATANTLQSVAHGGTLTAPAPTRTGYTFEGWHTDSDLTALYSSAPVLKDFTLYAKWEEVPPDPTDWEAVTDSTFGTSAILGIAYGDGKFVAVGGNYGESKIAYSTDGINWNTVTNSTFGNNNIQCITYGDGKFVAGGSNGKMAYSTDGITWAAVTDSTFGTTNNTISGIAYGDGKFVAGGTSAKMAYSTDGVNWNTVNNSSFIYAIASITYGNGKFVAGGGQGSNRIAYSLYGDEYWNPLSNVTSNSSQAFYGIAYGGGTFVAGGDGGNNSKIAYSTDGQNWTTTNNPLPGQYGGPPPASDIRDIAYGGGTFVAVGDNGKMAYSLDGINWNTVTNSTFGTRAIYGIAYGDGKFVAGGDYGIIAVCTP